MMLTAFLSGLMLGSGLIVAIGSQNMFVLRQGLGANHVGVVVLFCGAADTLLVAAGVTGAGTMLRLVPGLATMLRLGGVAFLAWYGWDAFRRMATAGSLAATRAPALPLGRVLATTAAFTFLNPHVYLDTVLLMGAAGATHPADTRPLFVAGAACASFGWFGLLGYGARRLAPVFARPGSWRILDGLVGATMLVLAIDLLRGVVRGG